MTKDRPMTEEQFEKAWIQTKATMELEGFTMTKEDKETAKKVCLGKMTREELIKKLKHNA